METLTAPPAVALPDPDPVLLEAARLLREGWVQFSYKREPRWIFRLLGARPRYCLVGAVNEALLDAPSLHARLIARDRYIEMLGFPHESKAEDWNDASDRTPEEVVERVERAAYGL